MFLNKFFGIKEGFEAMGDGLDEEPIDLPDLDLDSWGGEVDTTDYALQNSLDISFNIPEGDDCRNDLNRDRIMQFQMNKYNIFVFLM